MMRSRTDLIEYLCRQQHSCTSDPRVTWSSVPPDLQDAMRASTRVMLQELEDLGLMSVNLPAA